MLPLTTQQVRNLGSFHGNRIFNTAIDLDKVLADPHKIDGRTVEVKKAVPKDRAPGPVSEGGKGQGQAPGKRSSGPSAAGNSSFESKKIFVGGLPSSVKDEDFKQYFQSFGKLVDAVVMIDRTTKRSRGFGFVTFEEEGAVAEVLSKSHQIHDKSVEIKRAEPKEKSGGGRGNRSDGGGGGRGGYGYGYGYGAPVGGRGGYGYGGGYGAGGYGGYPPAYGGGGYGGYGGYGAPPGAGGYGYPPPPYGGEGADASGPGGYGGGYGYGGYGGEQGGYGGYPPPAYGGGYGGPGGEGDDPRGGSPGQSGEDAQQYNSSRPNGRSDRYRPY